MIIIQTLNFGGLTQMKQPYKEKYRATNSIIINEPKPSYKKMNIYQWNWK